MVQPVASKEESTLRQRRQHFRIHIDPIIGRDKLAELTSPDIYKFDTKLRDAGISLAMRKKILTNLKTMLSFCQGRGYVAQNVALAVRVGTKADKRKTKKLTAGVDVPSRAELKVLMDAAAGR